MVAAGELLAGAVGAEDVSVDCPAGEAPVGTAVKSSPFAKTLKKAVRITGDINARQDAVATRALHIAHVSTPIPAASRISEAGARLWRLPSFVAIQLPGRLIHIEPHGQIVAG